MVEFILIHPFKVGNVHHLTSLGMVVEWGEQDFTPVRHVVTSQRIVTLAHFHIWPHRPCCQGQGGIVNTVRNWNRHVSRRNGNFPDDVNRLFLRPNLRYRLQVKILNIAIIIGCLLGRIPLNCLLGDCRAVIAHQLLFNLLVKNQAQRNYQQDYY